MGMTDAQFKAFIRFLLSMQKDMMAELDPEKKQVKMNEILDNLQKILEE